MSEQVLGLDKDNVGTSKKSIDAYKCAWLGRWTRMGSDAAVQSHSCVSLKEDAGCSKELSLAVGPEIAVGVTEPECRRVDTVEETIKENHRETPGDERRDVLPFPMFNVSQQRDNIAASRNAHDTLCHERLQPYPELETLSKERSLIFGDDISEEQHTKSCEFIEKNILGVSSSFHDVIGSSSKAAGNEKRPWMQSLMCTQEENAVPTPRLESKEKLSSNYFPSFPFQAKSAHNSPDLTRPVRIYTTVDSVQGPSREPYRFSQATRHFLFSKKTNVNLSEDVQLFRESTVSMKLKGKMFSGFVDLFPDLRLRHQGVRLQALGGSKDSEGLEKIDEVKSSAVCSKNESSAETDTMYMDNFQRSRPSGILGSTSSLPAKVKERENQSALPRAEIPDMNQEPPVVPDRENSVDGHGGETSTSKTQSMNVEHFLSNSELPTECNRAGPEPEPSSRWVKRLKTTASDSSGRGTKSTKMEEVLPGKKVNDIFLKIMKSRITNPEARNQEPSTSEIKNSNSNPNRGGEEITLLHPWIQRWCKNKATSSHRPAEPEVSREAENPKETALDEIQKKQFPSIAAMALMGKALSGFSPSGLRKSGSVSVWNTRDLR